MFSVRRLVASLLLLTVIQNVVAVTADQTAVERIDASVVVLMDALQRIGGQDASRVLSDASALRQHAKQLSASGDHQAALDKVQQALVAIKTRIAELKASPTEVVGETFETQRGKRADSHDVGRIAASVDALNMALQGFGGDGAQSTLDDVADLRKRSLQLSHRDDFDAALALENKALVLIKTRIAALRESTSPQFTKATASINSATQQDVERMDSSVSVLLAALQRIGGDRETINKAQALEAEAMKLADQGDFDAALSLEKQALETIKSRIAELKKGTNPDLEQGTASNYQQEKRLQDMAHLSDSINALTSALNSIGEEKGRMAFVNEIGTQIAQHQKAADTLKQQGDLVEARAELDSAIVTVKTAISTLRNRETLVRSLDFANKEEEYLYEVDRYETYGMLISLLVEKRSFSGRAAQQIERFKAEASELHQQAQQSADSGNFDEAVKRQENSNRALLKAIRSGGIYVPG